MQKSEILIKSTSVIELYVLCLYYEFLGTFKILCFWAVPAAIAIALGDLTGSRIILQGALVVSFVISILLGVGVIAYSKGEDKMTQVRNFTHAAFLLLFAVTFYFSMMMGVFWPTILGGVVIQVIMMFEIAHFDVANAEGNFGSNTYN